MANTLRFKINFEHKLRYRDLNHNATSSSSNSRMLSFFSLFRFMFEFEYNSEDTPLHINIAQTMVWY